MKRHRLLLLPFLLIWGLSGCDLIAPNDPPTIEVDDDVYVEVHDDSFAWSDHIVITDDNDGPIPVHASMIDEGTFDINVLGSYEILIRVSDSEGASSNVSMTVHVQDTTPPVVSLLGEETITLRVGDIYTDPGVTITDNYDTILTFETVGTIDSLTAGTYRVSYYAVDSSENESDRVERTIIILPNTPTADVGNVTVTHDTIGFDIAWYDPQDIATITSIELYQQNALIASLSDPDELKFTSLYSDTTYTIRLSYIYDLGDGQGIQSAQATAQASTLAKATTILSPDYVTTTQDSWTFALDIQDPDQTGTLTAIELFLGDVLVQSLDDLSIRTFDGLLSDTTYRIQFAYTYDLNDGQGVQIMTAQLEDTTLAKGVPGLTINASGTTDSIAFDVLLEDPDAIATITAIELHQGETVVATLTELTERSFASLLSDTDYTIVLTLTYDLNDGQGEQSRSERYPIRTLAKTLPTLEMDLFYADQETLWFDFTVTDPDDVGAITAIDLLLGDTVVQSLTNLTLREFTNLLSNTEYTLSLTLTYDLNDGQGEQTWTQTSTFTTLAKTAPTLTIDDVSTTQDIIEFSYTWTDPDDIGEVVSIELYQGDTLIESLNDLSLRSFTALLSNTSYALRITYSYDLNDGSGIETNVIEVSSITTLPALDVSALSVSTDPVIAGEPYRLYIDLTNEGNLTIDHVVIDGVVYNAFLFGTTPTRLILEWTDTTSGTRTINVESIGVTFSSGAYSYEVEESLTYDIISSVQVDSFGLQNGGDFVAYANEVFQIDLINKSLYPITAITINGTTYDTNDFLTNTGTTLTLPLLLLNGLQTLTIESIAYIHEETTLVRTITNNNEFTVFASSDPIHHIWTVTDLLNLDLDGINILMADLDLTGVTWTPIGSGAYYTSTVFKGYFDGNGYTISNLNLQVDTNQNASEYYGFFGSTYKAYLNHIVLSNVTIDVMISDTTQSQNMIGILAGTTDRGTIKDITVDGSVTVVTYGQTYVGGLIGYDSGSDITSVLVDATVSASSANHRVNVGGVIGATSDTTLDYAFASGSVVGTSGTTTNWYGPTAGGLVGSNGGSITRSIADATVTSTSDTFTIGGGLIGSNNDHVASSIALGDVTVTSSGTTAIGAFQGTGQGTATNVYETTEQTLTLNGTIHSGVVLDQVVSRTLLTTTWLEENLGFEDDAPYDALSLLFGFPNS